MPKKKPAQFRIDEIPGLCPTFGQKIDKRHWGEHRPPCQAKASALDGKNGAAVLAVIDMDP